METHKYITSALLFFFSFTLLPLFLVGRLAQTLPVWYSYDGILQKQPFKKHPPPPRFLESIYSLVWPLIEVQQLGDLRTAPHLIDPYQVGSPTTVWGLWEVPDLPVSVAESSSKTKPLRVCTVFEVNINPYCFAVFLFVSRACAFNCLLKNVSRLLIALLRSYIEETWDHLKKSNLQYIYNIFSFRRHILSLFNMRLVTETLAGVFMKATFSPKSAKHDFFCLEIHTFS